MNEYNAVFVQASLMYAEAQDQLLKGGLDALQLKEALHIQHEAGKILKELADVPQHVLNDYEGGLNVTTDA